MTRKLILVKHAKPQTDPAKPSHEWTLSDEGRQRCTSLAERLREHAPRIIVTSDEPKAIETGQIVSQILGVPTQSSPGLQEHDRSNVPMMQTREFISMIAMFFKRHDELVLGRESAAQALTRFDDAISAVLAQHSEGHLAIITHGTVLALFAERHANIEPFALWRRMGLPSFLVFDLPGMRVVADVPSV